MAMSYTMDGIVHYYKCYNKMMSHWKNLFPNKIYDLYYEQLISNQKNVSIELFKHCNIGWDDSYLDFYNNKNAVFTASSTQVKQKIYNSSVEKWKNYEKHLEKAKELLADEIAEYETELSKILS